MAIRVSIIILIVAFFLLAETLVSGTTDPEVSHLSELLLPFSYAH